MLEQMYFFEVIPILTDLIESTHLIDKYFADYRIEIDQIPYTALLPSHDLPLILGRKR